MRRYYALLLLVVFACEPLEHEISGYEIIDDSEVLDQRIEMINQTLDVIVDLSARFDTYSSRVMEDAVEFNLTPEQDCSNCTRIISEDQSTTIKIDEGEVVGIAEGGYCRWWNKY